MRDAIRHGDLDDAVIIGSFDRRGTWDMLAGLALLLGLVGLVSAEDRSHPATVSFMVMCAAAGVLLTTRRSFARHVVGRATPGTLGAMRMYICLVMAAMTLLEQIGTIPTLPPTHRHSMGVMDWLYHVPGITALSESFHALLALKLLTFALLMLGAIGYRTRIVLPLAALGWLILGGVVRSFLIFSHNGVLPFYLIVVLCFTPCADGFSLDRLLRIWRGEPVAPPDRKRAVYAWSRTALWMVVAMIYLAAGMSKLREGGWMWWDSTNMQQILFRGAYRPFDKNFDIVLALMHLPPFVFALMGLGSLLTELGMGLTPFSRAARLIMPPMALGMHVGIYLFQRIRFWDFMALQLLFFDWSKARVWVAHRMARRRGRITVRFSGERQRRIVQILSGLDLFQRIRFEELPQSATPGSMVLLWRQKQYVGGDALPVLAGALPLLWPLWPVLKLEALRRSVVRSIRSLPAPGVSMRALPAASHSHWRFAGPGAVCGVACIMLGAWFARSEFFPLTSMRMYSDYNGSGVIEYFRLLQTTRGGVTGPAYLDRVAPNRTTFHVGLWDAFRGQARRERCLGLLRRYGQQWNESAPPEEQIARFEIQKKRWDFVRDRDNPDLGEVVGRVTVNFTDDATASAR